VQVVLIELGASQTAGKLADHLLERGLRVGDHKDVCQVVTLVDLVYELPPLVRVEQQRVLGVRSQRLGLDHGLEDGATTACLEPEERCDRLELLAQADEVGVLVGQAEELGVLLQAL